MAEARAYPSRADDDSGNDNNTNDTPHGPAEARYRRLSQEREPWLQRARQCAALTIPLLIPPDDAAKGADLPSLYQSVGAGGVTNLASKLLLTMLPPNEPCFRLRLNNLMLEKEQEDVDKEFRTRIEKALSRVERAVLADIEDKGDRSVVYEGNEHLIVGGNVLYYDDPQKGLRLFPLSRFVVRRDPSGNAVEIITEEEVDLDALPQKTAEAIRAADSGESPTPEGRSRVGEAARRDHRERQVRIYTHLRRKDRLWKIKQECRGITLPGSEGSYPVDACPWFPARMYSVAGEAYGRSFVELQLGDLASLESLNQSLVEGSAVSAKAVGLVNPNGVTSAKAVAEAANGDFVEGNPNDVAFLQVQKGADFQVVAAQIQVLEQRLKTAFLMMDGVRRQAERVTAEEIRVLAQELETGLGGVYTVISQEFQMPFIRSRMARMTREKRLPPLPGDSVRPSVVTGFDALGRGNDKAKLVEFLQFCAQTLGENFLAMVNPHNAVMRLATSIGIDMEGLIKDEQTLQAEQAQAQQQAQQQQMLERLGPEALRQFGGMVQNAQQQPQPDNKEAANGGQEQQG